MKAFSSELKTVYMMGICGTAMASLAGMLKAMGYQVRGSDQSVYPPMSTMLENLGIELREGYKPENLEPRPDLVIVGNVMSAHHEEVQALLKSGIPYTSMAKCLGDYIIEDRDSYVVAGTHGKTTTTALLSWVMEFLSMAPGFLVGGIPKNFPYSFKAPEGDVFVVEGDEYDTAFFDKVPKFTHYKPKYVILNSIEFDHADIYRDLDHVKEAFSWIFQHIHPEGCLIYKEGDDNILSLLKKSPEVSARSFGVESGDYHLANVRYTEEYCYFDAYYREEKILEIASPLFGEYNLWNVLAVVAMAHARSWDLEKVANAIREFQGVKRRQEKIWDGNAIQVYEDFAHHPTAVALSVSAMKQRFAKQRLLCFFEPRSATSRRKIFQKAYAEAFQEADQIWIAKAFNQDKIAQEDRFSSEDLVNDLKRKGKDARSFSSVDEAVKACVEQLHKGDRILIMSNGGFDGIYQKLIHRLENFQPKG